MVSQYNVVAGTEGSTRDKQDARELVALMLLGCDNLSVV